MTAQDLRLAAFKLKPAHLGNVWIYQWNNDLWQRWQEAEHAYKDHKKRLKEWGGRLPYASLALALTAASGGFVRISPKKWNDVFLVSSKEIPKDTLQMALLAWERQITGTDSDIFRGVIEGPMKLEQLGARFEADVTPGWAWEVAKWHIAEALSQEEFAIQGPSSLLSLPLRLDTRADLLTWSDEGLLYRRDGTLPAMHVISLNIKKIPGQPGVYLLPQGSLSRVGSFNLKSARLDAGPNLPLLRVTLKKIPPEHGSSSTKWETRYEGWADKVLKAVKDLDLPPINDDTFKAAKTLRGIHRVGWHPINKGVGPQFYEYLSQHILKVLGDVEPYGLRWNGRMKNRTLPPRGPVDAVGWADIRQTLGSTPRLVVLYESKKTRRHLEDTIVDLLGGDESALASLSEGESSQTASGIEVAFERVFGLSRSTTDPGELRASVKEAIARHSHETKSMIALVETLDEAGIETARKARGSAKRGGKSGALDGDPKGHVRVTLAGLGVISQFISPFSDERGELHQGARQHYPAYRKRQTNREIQKTYREVVPALKRARNALWDLLSSGGISLRPHLNAASIPEGTWLVGAHSVQVPYTDRKKQTKDGGWVLILTAMQVGGLRTLGWNGESWVPHNAASAHHHNNFPQHMQRELGAVMEEALSALEGSSSSLGISQEGCGVVVFIPMAPTRRWWSGIGDTSTAPLPAILGDLDAALVRTRIKGDEVPGVTGRGPWPEPGSIPKSVALNYLFCPFEEATPPRAYWVSETLPRSMNQTLRDHTRYQVQKKGQLGKDWHSNGVTEILIMRTGPFDAKALTLLTVQQLRAHPAYHERSLRRPLPLHLAYKVLKDHPRFHLQDEEERAEET